MKASLTPANVVKVRKAARELDVIATAGWNARSHALALLRVNELLAKVMEDLVFRPEVNGGEE